MRGLTPRQKEILIIIRTTIEHSGMPPTRAEIAKLLGFRSANAAEEHLRALQKKGYIDVMRGTSRGLRLIKDENGIEVNFNSNPHTTAANDIPQTIALVGKVAAGQPILATEHVEDQISIPPNFFHPPADFMLRVEGESMRDIGIMDGDLLAVSKTNIARDGEVVVARVNDEVTVKRFERKDKRHVLLHAENQDFSPIPVDLKTDFFAIEGKAVGVIRR